MAAAMPEEFAEQVREVLEHLFDIPYLYQHPLTPVWATHARVPIGRGSDGRSGSATALRQAAQAAVEALNPGDRVPFRSPAARLYQLLHLRFIEGLTVQETARELAISERQVYRDLRRGTETVALALWQQLAEAAPPRAVNLSSIETEVERVEAELALVDLAACLERSARSLERLAQSRGVRLTWNWPQTPVRIWSHPTAAQQVLTSFVSLAVQRGRPGALAGELREDEKLAVLTLQLQPEAGERDLLAHLAPAATTLLARLGWRAQTRLAAGGAMDLTLQMPAAPQSAPAVLVIDDNEELLELVARYLADHAVRVTTARQSREGLQLARTLHPAAVILDVMMPDTDGWEVLQTLKTWPETAQIPIIVCSVFHDPELAYSLGAAAVLAKPVRRHDVLDALRRLGIV